MKYPSLAVLAALVASTPNAGASGARFQPDLTEAVSRLDAARGPEAYAALRRVWDTWDRADPTHVEEALRLAESDTRLSPAARVYAALLSAHARTRRGDLAAAHARIARLGYVDRWLIAGPFENDGKSGFDTATGPEGELGQAITLGRTYQGKERAVGWRAVPPSAVSGWLDTGAFLRPETKMCALATTFVRDAKDSKTARDVSVWVGVSGAFKLFWNGEQRLADASYRGLEADREAALVELKPGVNSLTVKVCGDEAAPMLALRIGDASGGPNAGVKVDAELASSEAAASNAPSPGKGTAAKAARGGLEGPLQAFARLTAAGPVAKPGAPDRAAAADLYAFADYLNATGGDDPATHQARNLARRAAEREPTVERLLLAGELAEDLNQMRDWVSKAETLAERAGTPDKRVLLARAQLAHSSPNWREAFPYFDRVLAVDPDDVDALRGRVELYNEVGLRRTGLALLQSALERNPTSVNLLNMVASQLRSLGRATEAGEVEARYAGFRFDDRSYLNSMIELALARRDRAAAERWVDRLLQLDPDSQWAFGVAARAYRALAQPDRAVATYRRALELAPEEVATLRALSDLQGELGKTDEQLSLLRRILTLRPQDKDVRQYVEHIEPPKARADEAYAWESSRFLLQRNAPAAGQVRRTLRDLQVTTVYSNGLSSKFRQVVFQPLTDSAAAAARQYGFGYQADREVVQLRGARVYRADGHVDEAIESGEGPADDPSIAMYTSARNFYVQLPRLEPGDVVELRYRIDEVTPNNELKDYFGEVVYLPSSEPVANAEYVLITPKSRAIHVDAQVPGLVSAVQEKGDERVYRFSAAALAAVTPEPSMPPWAEVLGMIHVSTFQTWKEMGSWYWGLAHEQFDLDDETRKLAREIGKGAKTDLDKVKAVYGWVIQHTRYVALEFGIYGYKPHRCVQTVTRGWGDCKDKATAIVTLLKELGVPATIVILRTQMRGDFSSAIASLAPFDHAIAYVPSLDLYLDGTAEYTGVTELPRMDLGSLGLLINEGDAKPVRLPRHDPGKNVIERRVVATLEASGEAHLELDYLARGVEAPEWRRRYHADGTRRERITSDLASEFSGFTLLTGASGVLAPALADAEQPVQLHVRGAAPTFARREGRQLSLAVTTNFRLTPAYASLSRRSTDVRILALSTIDDVFTIRLPRGAKVVSLPPAAQGDGAFGSYSVSVEQSAGQVVVKSRVALKIDRVKVADYAAWSQFCAEVDRALAPRLVVEP